MIDRHQPEFTYNPRSLMYCRRVPVPYYMLDGPGLRKYREGGERREIIIEAVKRACRTEMIAKPTVESITVYDEDGNTLHVWTRGDLGL